MVEPAVEANLELDPRFFDSLHNGTNLFRGQVNRLLTEYMLACLCRLYRNIGVGVR